MTNRKHKKTFLAHVPLVDSENFGGFCRCPPMPQCQWPLIEVAGNRRALKVLIGRRQPSTQWDKKWLRVRWWDESFDLGELSEVAQVASARKTIFFDLSLVLLPCHHLAWGAVAAIESTVQVPTWDSAKGTAGATLWVVKRRFSASFHDAHPPSPFGNGNQRTVIFR